VKSTEENKAIVRRAYIDGMNTRDMGIIEEVFSPEYISHFPGQPPTQGIEPIKAVLQSFFDAFPDIVFKIEDQLAEGDRVATRWSAQGTHQGEWRGFPPRAKGIPPTGRHVTFSATDIYLIAEGQIAEEWNTLEQLAVLEQIGAVPEPE
jgi:predicted ester cyclase